MNLELDDPDATCSACSFTSSLTGRWTVEDGQLVFRADPDPLQSRGPDFNGCSECGSKLTGIVVRFGGPALTAADVHDLQVTANLEQP